jgi:serine/threonine-protein kinase
LYYRRLDQLRATLIPGTEDAGDPFFSPDGRWVAFFANGKLKKVSVSGGAVVALADALISRGGTWGEDDVITFTPQATPGVKALRIPATGGTASELGEMAQGHVTQRWPHALPGNRAILYTGFTTVDSFEDACGVAQPLSGGSPRILQCGGYGWQYVESGHLVYVHSGTLFAVPFDIGSMTVTGDPVPVIDGVLSFSSSGVANFAVASNGLLAYIPGSEADAAVPLDVIDRDGNPAKLPLPPQAWRSIAYSPDGKQLAIEVAASRQSDIWIYDIARNTLTRLTLSNVQEGAPVWTPDGKRIAYTSARGGPPNLFWRAADGSGEEQRIAKSDAVQAPSSWDPSGRQLMIIEQSNTSDYDIAIVPLEGDPASGITASGSRKLVATPSNEAFGKISPDGQWFAYASDESGTFEVYVRAMTGSGGRWQISTGGGAWPAWSPATQELVYGTINGAIMAAKYEERNGSFVVGRPERWSPQNVLLRSTASPFTLHPDGKHMVASLLANQPDSRPRSFVVVTNFFDELRGVAKAR